MFQTLVLIASIVVLASAILTSSLVSARNAFHQVVAAKTQTAMTDATSQFTTWAQTIISTKGGTEQNWVGAVNPVIPTKSMCVTPGPCQFYETTTWIVTGATTGVLPSNTSGKAQSVATNMAAAVDEQRLSATLSVSISNSTGHSVLGGRSQEVTARLLSFPPYIVITGLKDLGSTAETDSSTEGDSGGHVSLSNSNNVGQPIAANPSYYTNTIIRATMDCYNTASFDQTNPTSKADEGNGNIRSLRNGGILAWSYQLPCLPHFAITNPPISAKKYSPPIGSTYQIDASDNNQVWINGDQGQIFPR